MQHAASFWTTLVLTVVAFCAVAFLDESTMGIALALLVPTVIAGIVLVRRKTSDLASIGRGLLAGSGLCVLGFAALYAWIALYMRGVI